MQTETSSDGFRLSPQQRRLWGLAQADPAWPCHVQALFELEGELDREIFQAAVRQVVAAHEILRTELVSRLGYALPLQIVSDRTALRFHEIDLESLGTDGPGIDPVFAEIAGETCGVWLVRRTAGLHALILSLPAFYADGKGLRNLAREILSAYAECCGGPPPEMDPVQYGDVAEVFQQLLEREDTEAARAYWREWKPDGPAPRLEIAREGAGRESAAPGPRVLPRSAAARLEELARREGSSLEDLLVALWLVLLARLGGGPRITVGVAADGRDEEGLEGALGLFARYLPLQVEVVESLEVGVLARRVHAALGEMRRWQDFFDGESSGVFPFCFDFARQEDCSCAGLKLRPLRERGGPEPFHLGLACRRSVDELSFGLSHDGRLYDAAQAGELELRFGVLIEELLASPGARVGELAILTPAERRLLLVEVNDTGAAGDLGRCAHELFEEQAARTPDAVAVRAGDRALTYGELEAGANRLASFLRKLGVGPETRVGVRMERSPDLLVALLGILKAGGAYVPVDSTHPEERQAFLLEDADVSLLLTEGDGEGTGVRRLSLERSRDAIARESACRPPAMALPGQLAYVLYTSGSTGRPKGVMVPHAGLVNYLRWCGRAYMAGHVSTVPVHSPLGFDLTVTSLLAPLTVGWTVALLPDGTGVEALAEAIAGGGPWGLLKITPSHLEVLAQLLEERRVEARVGALIVGGEALRGESLELWARHAPATRVVNEYGPTEAVVGCCTYELAAGAMSAGPVAIGRPIDNARIYLLGPGLQPVPPGVPGQLFLGGIGLARGYQGAPQLTAGRFLPDPFSEQPGSRLYVTGDLARWLPGGQLEFLGRVDHQVKIRGFRIEPGEIEAVLDQHPAVREAVVIAREDAPGDQRLVSYLVLEPGSSLDPADLRQWARRTLPEHMVPSAYVELKAIPLTVNGKVDRAALPAPAGLEPQADHAAPRTPVEDEIAAIWREILGVENVGRKDNFFDLGGHSLLVARVRRRLEQRFGRAIAMVDLFRHPTVASLAAFLDPRQSALAETAREVSSVPRETGSEIAIVGMTGRFPGASSVAELWRNLRDGVEGITFFSEDELRTAGIAPRLLGNPRYVRAQGVLRDVESFDAAFFGFSPREAELTDPQQRVFLECAWEALESAGYDPERYPGKIGVFAGVSANTYWHHLASNPQLVEEVGGFQLVLANDKDFLPTRVSYKLNLTGPSVNVQTACSTSLVAIHLACRSLRSREADMALAGGISIRLPQQAGYLYQEGGISSPDGHCRAFDARAQGTLRGNGVGVVVLKRLSDALADGDFIHAVIKGSAVNNDGARKIGFTAPSVEGQVAVLREAFADAGVEPETLSYVEAHGTGTALGDPIEVAALSEALGGPGRKGDLCALGSVKTNVGHLDAAAGVTGLIKTVLALEHRAIPPSLHFEEPNPEIDFANGPCYVNGRLAEWEPAGHPRRAGVSAFGIGGTNAHIVLEEAPALDGTAPSRRWQLIPLSARTPAALEAATANLADFLAARGDASLADVAYTLQVGRRAFQHRRIVVADSREGAIEALRTLSPERVFTQAYGSTRAPVVFLFPGQGSQSAGMGRELYETEPAFREQIDRCAERLRTHLGFDFRRELYPEAAGEGGALDRTSLTQPVLFSFEYALARLWMEWGVHPQAMVGHSLGEYVAACLAGVFTLEEALDLVAERGRMMQQLPAGSMLAVRLPEDEIRSRLLPGLSLAAVNGPSDCVVSGPADILDTLQRSLAGEGHQARPVATSHAFHSAMMDPILEAFAARVRQVSLRPPRIPFLSNLTGTWITDAEATDPEYWAWHLRHPVQFSRNLEALFADPERLFLEVGPGRTLGALLLRHRQCPSGATVLASLNRTRNRGDLEAMLEARGRLWLAGVELEEPGLWARERRRRRPLPTYPWERQRFWIEPGREELSRPAALQRREEIADWFHVPSWRRTAPPTPALRQHESQCWLVFAEGHGLSSHLIEQLEAQGQTVVAVEAGGGFEQLSDGAYLLDPRERGDYEALVRELRRTGRVPRRVVHLWNTGERAGGPPTSALAEEALYQGFYSLIFLVQALGGQSYREPLDILVASTGLHDVTGRETLHPERATLLGACRVLPQELRQVSCRSVDLDMPGDGQAEETARRLLAELDADPAPGLVAYRGKHRWVEGFDTIRLQEPRNEAPRLRERGTYLLTGGLGGLALEVARDLARQVQARLVLVGRTPLPPPEEWDSLIAAPDTTEALRRRIAAVRDLEELGAEVQVLSADVSDREQMREAIAQAQRRFGDIHGVIHTAGVAGGGLIDLKSPRESAGVLDPKVRGTLILRELFQGTPLDFLVLFSSLNSVLGGFGQADYCAANAFLDAFAHWSRSEDGTACTSIGWVAWQDVGMAADARPAGETPEQRRERLGHGVSTADGVEAFHRILATDLPQVLVSPRDLAALVERVQRRMEAGQARPEAVRPQAPRHARPDIATSYAAPRNEAERTLSELYAHLLGLERVGIHDNFFEIGGDSLLSIQIVARAGEAGLRITTQQVFEHPTVAELAAAITGGTTIEPEPAGDPEPDRAGFPLARLDPAALARIAAEHGDVEDIYPLSPTQSGMLFFHLYAPDSEAYFQLMVWTLRGALDVPAFKRAWDRLVQRHSVLRTCFVWQGLDEPHQVVHRTVELPWIEEDLRGLSEDERRERLRELLREDRGSRLDLSRSPILRLAILRLGEEEYQFVWSWHHILFDGWSMTLLTRQAMGAYHAELRGEAPDAEPVPQYRDYIAWLERQDRGAAEIFWRRALEGFDTPTPLPLDRSPGRLVSQRQRVRGQRSVLSTQETTELKAFARRHQLTLSTLVQGAWALLLSAASGERDVVFGITSSGRPASLPGVESIVGLMITTLPLRATAASEAGLIPWLRRLQQNQAEVRRFEHSSLAQIQAWSSVPGDRVLFDSLLVSQGNPVDVSVSQFGEKGPSVANHGGLDSTSYPLVVYVVPGRELQLRIAYDSLRFDAPTIHRLRLGLKALLRDMAAAPEEATLSDLLVLGEAERQQILVEWNDSSRGLDETACVHHLFEAWADRDPGATAVVLGNESWTYGELERSANRLAHHLLEFGVGTEDRVGICLERSFDLIAALLAVLKAGAAYVPLDPAHPAERLSGLAREAGLAALITRRTLASAFSGPVPRFVFPAEEPALALCSERRPARTTGGDALAFVMFTSGSTGRPKGVLVPHRGLASYIGAIIGEWGLGPEDRVLQFASPGFDTSAEEIYGCLGSGAALVLRPEGQLDSVASFLRLCREQEVSVLDLPTAYWHILAAELGDDLELPPRVRLVVLGGEAALSERLGTWWEKVPASVRLVNTYGPSEATIVATSYEPVRGQETAFASRTVPIGSAVPNARVYLLGKDMRPVTLGRPGALSIGGAGVARGYLNDARLTAEKFTPDPFSGEPGARLYATGDLARRLPDGALEFLDRIDNQVKLRGIRIEPGEIEAALGSHPTVRESAVVVRDGGAESRHLVAYVVAEPGETPTVEELRDFLRGRLPSSMVPSAFVLLAALPLTPSGKIDRGALPAPEKTGLSGRSGILPAGNPLEAHLTRIWEEVLDTRPIGVTDSFFELGGHSLLVVRLMSRLAREFHRDLPLATLFQEPTIQGLAKLLRSPGLSGEGSAPVPLQPQGDRRPLFFVHPMGGTIFCYLDLARQMGSDQPFYALQAPGPGESGGETSSIEALAAHHLEAIRTVQPESPYRLGGWSMGGVVAFEMARQLAENGEPVELVALVDVSAPVEGRIPPALDGPARVAAFARDLGRLYGRPLAIPGTVRLKRSEEEALRRIFDRAQKDGTIPGDVRFAEILRLYRIFEANHRAVQQYLPGGYPGRLTLFASSRGQASSPLDATLGWRELADGGVEVHAIPGDHYSIVQPPQVEILAERLRDALERTERDCDVLEPALLMNSSLSTGMRP